MDDIRERIVEEFGNRVRVRVCGICIEDECLLMVNHLSLNKEGDFWGPPGGGMEFGQSAEENLRREFLEETGLVIEVEKFLFVHEYLKPPLHAIELVYKVNRVGGQLIKGQDPEMGKSEQIINDVQFISLERLKSLNRKSVHQMFRFIETLKSLEHINGYFIGHD